MVRAKLGFDCELSSTYHRYHVQILVNQSGQILCEGELVQLEEVRECYRSVFAEAVEDEFPFVALDPLWSGTHPSVIGEMITSLAEEHWTLVRTLAVKKHGVPLCDLSEKDLRNLAGTFEVILLRTPAPPPPAVVGL